MSKWSLGPQGLTARTCDSTNICCCTSWPESVVGYRQLRLMLQVKRCAAVHWKDSIGQTTAEQGDLKTDVMDWSFLVEEAWSEVLGDSGQEAKRRIRKAIPWSHRQPENFTQFLLADLGWINHDQSLLHWALGSPTETVGIQESGWKILSETPTTENTTGREKSVLSATGHQLHAAKGWISSPPKRSLFRKDPLKNFTGRYAFIEIDIFRILRLDYLVKPLGCLERLEVRRLKHSLPAAAT